MRRFTQLFLALALSLLFSGVPARAATVTDLPPPFDSDTVLFERYWSWLLQELEAPPDLPWPRIDIEPLPRTVRMAFTFPTEDAPWHETRIVLSPRSVDRAAGPRRLEVFGELAHEIVHYVMILAENGWDAGARPLVNDVHHHCDPEFMRLTRQMAGFIWDRYHSNDAVRAVNHMVQLACWRDGHNIGLVRKP